ncbi:MAG: Ribosomal RNA large subunit methyltransferase H [Candidatus Uhrbacteria bacterium GW2011_GWF2_41_16]|jgi:23S rRNA (pseudouridine1915-N3)-methyltransferase|uniref:Ribosomal RNA large subunit methyltransferase H n=2 Tax=Candidatus Uhriibacteriota TaxID=1752732 RepID=A0A0G0YBS4_9BACT|nr:MAG: Ribosomal RNA large subunit methyltransferase H [Candidatus Uhrbacteria bacterium GW2011_GWC2_41_11]KKR97772.1 MAG: Ribosomal RNA large subunit methyltransferase H [Candidatus Uhrbacteria bacterium GW2011_GWF2_41_16]HBO99884.1 hypothetical protein [Candidatus Uhrbacteria bacterium]
MYKVHFLMVGKAKKGPLQDITEKYRILLRPYIKEIWQEVSDIPFRKPEEKIRVQRLEQDHLSSVLPKDGLVILLDESGKTYTSTDFAQAVDRWSEHGTRTLVFVIGGPLGFEELFKKQAHIRLSLSPMTFPHDLARVVLLEQLYRAMTILRGKMYHY